MTEAPSQFSAINPKLQLAWDATSLSVLMTCAHKYQRVIIEGWRTPSNNDTEFGGFYASAVERFKKSFAASGGDAQAATVAALRYIIEATWLADAQPWGGSFEDQWRCTGTEPYRNARGNRAKCPWSHAGNWYPAPAPDICGECGSATELEQRWVSEDHAKDRRTLIRIVAWYCIDQADHIDGLKPYSFPNGTPAVELSFSYPSGYVARTGEPFAFAGHLDSISTYGGEVFVTDNKTTKHMLGEQYFKQFAPNLQVSFYNLTGNVLWPELKIQGVLIEAAQTLVGGSQYGMRVFYQSEARREEFYREIGWWLKQAERHAEEDYWPMNRSACYMCPLKMVCDAEPERREAILAANFVKRKWNPLEVRE